MKNRAMATFGPSDRRGRLERILEKEGEVVFAMNPWRWRYVAHDIAVEFHMERDGRQYLIDDLDPFQIVEDRWQPLTLEQMFGDSLAVLTDPDKKAAIARVIAAMARNGKTVVIWSGARARK